jgi:hypothetical protein
VRIAAVSIEKYYCTEIDQSVFFLEDKDSEQKK